MASHRDYLVRLTDLGVDSALKQQCLDEGSELYGCIPSIPKGYIGGENGNVAATFLTAYYLEGSRYFRDGRMLERSRLALEFMLRMQKEDGTFDLKETNLHDGAQTSFLMTTMGPVVLMMRSLSRHTPEEDALYERLIHFVSRCADGMVHGGFHTPNHRWVMASALGMAFALTGRADCREKMQKLLNEGIDCDADGEYTEHSGGVYNLICDRAFLILAFVNGMTELYNTVARNLRTVLCYIEPDLTVNTMNSSRQDAGTMPTWRIYYGLFLFMALKTGDRQFRFVADRMLEQSLSRISWAGLQAANDDYVPGCDLMALLMTDGSLDLGWTDTETQQPDFNYTRFFKDSGVLRHTREKFSLTLVKQNPDFMLLKYGRHNALIRLCGTFYAQGQFVAEELYETEAGWHMTYRRRWGYKSPLPEPQPTSDWRKMDHTKREDVMMQDFVFHVDVTILENGAKIRVHTEGVECVLVKFEILLDSGARYSDGGAQFWTRPGGYLIQETKHSRYDYADGCALEIIGGAAQHGVGERMRGSLYRDEGRFTVAMTYETPMDDEYTLLFSE